MEYNAPPEGVNWTGLPKQVGAKKQRESINDDDDLESLVQKGGVDKSDDEKNLEDDDGSDVEDDPETYVNTEEKKVELEAERRNAVKLKQTAECYVDRMAVESMEFKTYIDLVIDHGKKN